MNLSSVVTKSSFKDWRSFWNWSWDVNRTCSSFRSSQIFRVLWGNKIYCHVLMGLLCSCAILSFTAVNLTLHFLLLRDWLTRLAAGFWLTGRIRVLSAVPPPSDDGHPLPTPDGKLPEQRGAKGTAVTRKSNGLLLHYFLRGVIWYFCVGEMKKKPLYWHVSFIRPRMDTEYQEHLRVSRRLFYCTVLSQHSVFAECVCINVCMTRVIRVPPCLHVMAVVIHVDPVDVVLHVFPALTRLSSFCQELFLPSYVSAVFWGFLFISSNLNMN